MRAMFVFVWASASLAAAADPWQDLPKLKLEPMYQAAPLYGALVFGDKQQFKLWMVHDRMSERAGTSVKDAEGKGNFKPALLQDVLYIDLDGDGDLTDPDERFVCKANTIRREYSFNRGISREEVWPRWEIAKLGRDEKGEPLATDVVIDHDFRWFKRCFYEIKLQLPGGKVRYAGSPLWLETEPQRAPIVAFEGPTTVNLAISHGVTYPTRYDGQAPDPPHRSQTEINPGDKIDFKVSLGTQGRGTGTFVSIPVNEIPKEVFVLAEFEFPNSQDANKPITIVQPLRQRCCGDCFFEPIDIPQGAALGDAKVTLTVVDHPEGPIAPVVHTFRIGK